MLAYPKVKETSPSLFGFGLWPILPVTAIFILVLPALLNARAKEKADLLVTGGLVVTLDQQGTLFDKGAIAIRGDRILAIGNAVEMSRRFTAGKTISAEGQVVMPGLVNTHNHAAMALLRGISDDLPLMDWLTKYIFPAEAASVDPDFVHWGTLLACAEMIRSGTTTFADMYYFEETVAEAVKSAGMRAIVGQTVLDFPAPDHKTPGAALSWAEGFFQRWRNDTLVRPAIAPHAPFTVSVDNLKACDTLARKFQVPLLIHLSETLDEQRQILQKYGTTPARHLETLGVLSPLAVAAHCVWVDDEDIKLLKKHEVGVAHNPESNMKLASGIAPIAQLLRLGVPVGLGTDGPASNNDLNLWEAMDIAGKLQKVHLADPTVLPAEQVVRMATILGAKALHLDSEIGSLEAGKKADLIILETKRAHLLPRYNLYSHLVNTYKGSDIAASIIAGKIVFEKGKLLTLDEPQILGKAQEYQRKIAARLKMTLK